MDMLLFLSVIMCEGALASIRSPNDPDFPEISFEFWLGAIFGHAGRSEPCPSHISSTSCLILLDFLPVDVAIHPFDRFQSLAPS